MKLVALIFFAYSVSFGMPQSIRRGASSPARRMKLPVIGMCLTMVFTGDFHLDLVI